MTVAYKLLKTGGKLPKNKDLRIVVHENMTVGMDRMGKNIEKATTLTTADLTGSLDALKAEIAYQLMEGNRVHLPGRCQDAPFPLAQPRGAKRKLPP